MCIAILPDTQPLHAFCFASQKTSVAGDYFWLKNGIDLSRVHFSRSVARSAALAIERNARNDVFHKKASFLNDLPTLLRKSGHFVRDILKIPFRFLRMSRTRTHFLRQSVGRSFKNEAFFLRNVILSISLDCQSCGPRYRSREMHMTQVDFVLESEFRPDHRRRFWDVKQKV